MNVFVLVHTYARFSCKLRQCKVEAVEIDGDNFSVNINHII